MKIRKIARWLLEQKCARAIRFSLWLRAARRDSSGTFQIARSAGYADLNTASPFFGDKKGSTTIFLLGSGSSVNELDNSSFEHIGMHVSIGINAWAIHSFVPDLYSFETGQDGDSPSQETKFVSSALQRRCVVEKNPQFIFLRPTPPASVRNLVKVPNGITNDPVIYGRANVFTTSKENLQDDLRVIAKAAARGKIPSNILLDNGASIIRLIWFSALQGFKDVVLVGIDLNRSPYFWYEPPTGKKPAKSPPILARPVNSPHNSLQTLDRPFPVDFFIQKLASVLNDEMGVRLWVSSASSSLARSLPLYPWPPPA